MYNDCLHLCVKSYDSRPVDRDLYTGPLEYETRVLTSEQRRSIRNFEVIRENNHEE